MRIQAAITAFLLSAALAGCGGGGGGGDQVATCGTMANPTPCGSDLPSTTFGPGSIDLSLRDDAGDAITQVSPEQAGTLRAQVRDVTGALMPNVAVTFQTTDDTGIFVPASGTALTDAEGIARVGLPAGAQTGAFTATATAALRGTTAEGQAAYAVAFPVVALSPLVINPPTLSAGGNASIAVAVTRGDAPYLPPQPVSFTSPCAAAGKAILGSPVLTQNGQAVASYSDLGCGVADVITATVALGDATVSRTGTLDVLPASAGSIKFVAADTTNIALKGTGGFGRQEFSTLSFQVADTTGSKVAGALVDFVFADSNTTQTVGGLTLEPSFATSDANGTVTTLVTAGTLPTSVRVVATLRGSTPPLTTLSNILVVSTGVPDQAHFSLATSIGNCEGRDFDQSCSVVTATLGDHFGNPAPDGTAVNFSTEAGIIDASCVTGSLLDPPPGDLPPGSTPEGQTTNSKIGPGSGTCSVLLRSSGQRPANGRVTVLAYALGEEDFFDNNGNNVFDASDTFTDKSPDIHRDDNESLAWNAGEACVGPNNGSCSTTGDGQYNGVLRNPQVPSAQTLYVSGQLVQIFSGSDAIITFNQSALACPPNGTADVQVTVTDLVGNIMPAESVVQFQALIGPLGVPVVPSSFEVNNVPFGVRQPMIVPTYVATVGCIGGSGRFTATVTTPNGVRTSASIPIN
jgi:hypothetical protein